MKNPENDKETDDKSTPNLDAEPDRKAPERKKPGAGTMQVYADELKGATEQGANIAAASTDKALGIIERQQQQQSANGALMLKVLAVICFLSLAGNIGLIAGLLHMSAAVSKDGVSFTQPDAPADAPKVKTSKPTPAHAPETE